MRSLGPIGLAVLSAACTNAPDVSDRPSPAELWTPAAITSPDYETTPTFTPDGREMIFFRGDPSFQTFRLYRSFCQNGAWSAAEPVPFAAPAPAIEADPGITPDGRRLYYVSTRHAPGSDDFDIWYVDRVGESWGEPRRLPAPVNSPAAELLPRSDAAGKLYFGSARAGGHGQGDIYVAIERNGEWRVSNVGAPVSTSAFEYEAEISRDGRTMIVVADLGTRSHLYRFEKRGSRWIARGRIPARDDVFQVGPLLSPQATQLIFAQAVGKRSGEMFLARLAKAPSEEWPPSCRR